MAARKQAESDLCYWPDCDDESYATDIPLCQFHIDMAWAIREAQQAQKSELRRWGKSHINVTDDPGWLGIVYYVRQKGGDIKIGYTTNLGARMVQLRLTIDDVLAAEPGTFKLEKKRHREFESQRRQARKEDFAPDPVLSEHMAEVRERHGDPNALWDQQMEHYRLSIAKKPLNIVMPGPRPSSRRTSA